MYNWRTFLINVSTSGNKAKIALRLYTSCRIITRLQQDMAGYGYVRDACSLFFSFLPYISTALFRRNWLWLWVPCGILRKGGSCFILTAAVESSRYGLERVTSKQESLLEFSDLPVLFVVRENLDHSAIACQGRGRLRRDGKPGWGSRRGETGEGACQDPIPASSVTVRGIWCLTLPHNVVGFTGAARLKQERRCRDK